jgi:hypothetical protein
MAGGRSESVSGEGGGRSAGVEGIEGGGGRGGRDVTAIDETSAENPGVGEFKRYMCGSSDGDAGTGNNHFAKT